MEASYDEFNQRAFDGILAALQQRDWQLETVQPLRVGQTNKSMIVAQGMQWYVLRMNNPQSQAMFINRQLEQKILGLLPEGLAPSVADYSEDFLLTEYVPHHTRMLTSQVLVAFMRVLKRVHAIDVGGGTLDYLARLREFLGEQQHTQSWQTLLAQLEDALNAVYQRFGHHRALCHHDLGPPNILWTKDAAELGPKIIDWEYAAMGDLFFDLACICELHQFDELQDPLVLQAYGLSPAMVAKLRVFRAIFAAIVKVWEQSNNVTTSYSLTYIKNLLPH